MKNNKKQNRYHRIYSQLVDLLRNNNDTLSKMSTIAAILHHKMPDFFWTGFYVLNEENELAVRCYQGPVACMILRKNTGVCHTTINHKKTIIVPNVDEFPGHIACDSRSKSEIVVPVRNNKDIIIGVLDIDSDKYDVFDDIDRVELEKIVKLI